MFAAAPISYDCYANMAELGAIDTNLELDKPADEILSDWIQCICVVTFDLEFGQAMEVLLWLSVHICRLAIFITYLCFCYTFFLFFIVGLSQQCQIIRRRQNKPLLSCFSRFQFWMHGRHSISCQDKVFSTFESQSMPYKL